MTNSTKTAVFLVALAVGLAGCENGRGSTASVAPTAPTRAAATLSGLVFAETLAGLKPIEGARVRLEIGSYRQDAVTDRTGRYRLVDLYDGTSTVTTTVDGYDTDSRTVTVSGDVRLDIRVTLRVEHTLFGQVYEITGSGRVPLEGVRILVHNDSEYFTGTDGFFTCPDIFNGVASVAASKDGYRAVFVLATIDGDTRLDIQLVRR